jgi:ATP-dependent helicase HrpB
VTRAPVTDLPIEPALPALLAALEAGPNAVLQAPPGAGKTTRVPLALLDAGWREDGRVLVVEPRRLAARGAAVRMASMLGEKVGETVGYRIRLDTKVSAATRVEVLTDGLFLRRLQDDPGLEGVAAVLFDEFHERRVDVDLALALCLQAQGLLRPDLRLVAMSATLDGAATARLLCDAPVVTSEGRAFPVETRHLDRPVDGRIEETLAPLARRALGETPGDILVFLPGAAEIARTRRLLEEGPALPAGTVVLSLHGDLSQAEQDRAVAPPRAGERRVILSSAIAETSLTIEGVTGVIDSGLMRVPRFDPGSGMTRLVTQRVSLASADQRRGRAGRLAPGICWRLWTREAERALLPRTPPEILAADLAPLALELARWGVPDPAELAWLDPPPAAPFAQARALLGELGALDAAGAVTPHGQAMADLGLHPRLAHMVLAAKGRGEGRLAALVAALLGERDLMASAGRDRQADLALRVDLALGARSGGAARRVREVARQTARATGIPHSDGPVDAALVGMVLAEAYPDRIAQRRPGSTGQFRLANGRGAALDPADPLASCEFLAVADLDGAAQTARIFLAARLDRADLEAAFAERIETSDEVGWDARSEAVFAVRRRRLGALVLDERPLRADEADVTPALLDGIRVLGLDALPWTDELRQWRARVDFAARIEPEGGWPDLSDAALLETLGDWLAAHLSGVTRADQLRRVDLAGALKALLDWNASRRLEAVAPARLVAPSGHGHAIDYLAGDVPVLALKLQEMFGTREHPSVGNGRVPLILHLLSPAGRPIAVTRDIAAFWAGGYADVRKDLRGRYPKHPWPEDPVAALATARAKPRGT